MHQFLWSVHLRGVVECHTEPLGGERGGSQPRFGARFLLVPFFWSWNSPMHFCSLKLYKFHMEMWHYKCLNNTLSFLPKGLIVWTDLCFVRTPFHLSISGVLHWFLCSSQSCLSFLPDSGYLLETLKLLTSYSKSGLQQAAAGTWIKSLAERKHLEDAAVSMHHLGMH